MAFNKKRRNPHLQKDQNKLVGIRENISWKKAASLLPYIHKVDEWVILCPAPETYMGECILKDYLESLAE